VHRDGRRFACPLLAFRNGSCRSVAWTPSEISGYGLLPLPKEAMPIDVACSTQLSKNNPVRFYAGLPIWGIGGNGSPFEANIPAFSFPPCL